MIRNLPLEVVARDLLDHEDPAVRRIAHVAHDEKYDELRRTKLQLDMCIEGENQANEKAAEPEAENLALKPKIKHIEQSLEDLKSGLD